jgi:hypothetical protein
VLVKIAMGAGIVVGVLILMGLVSRYVLTTDEERINDVIAEASDAGAAGDGERLCGLLTDEAQGELADAAAAQGLARTPAPSCEEAGEALGSSLPERVRESLLGAEGPEREVSIEGAEAEATATVAGYTEVLRLREEDGEWLLATALPEADVDESFVPSSAEETRVHIQGMCVAGANALTHAQSELLTQPGIDLVMYGEAMFDRAASSERALVARMHELAGNDAGGEVLREPLAAARRRAAALERAATVVRERPRTRLAFLGRVNRAYDAAFSAQRMELCQTLQGLTPG